MNLKIHRNIQQTGENIIEICTAKSKILIDCGANLDDTMLPRKCTELDIATYDAVFLAHSHTDYVGLENKTVYLSKLAKKIILSSSCYKMKKAPSFAGIYQNKVSITIGDIKITPILVDDEAYDAYLFLIESYGKCILYTGDYRANGRKSFEDILQNLPNKINTLICNGNGLTSQDINNVTEGDLEELAVEKISKKTGPVFILQSVTDFDHSITFFHSAKRNNRQFLEDLYLANIMDAIGNIAPNPNGFMGVAAFLTTGYKPEHVRYQMFRKLNRIDKNQIATQKFVMCVRSNMKKYLKSLSQLIRFYDGLLIVSPSAEEDLQATELIKFAQSKKLEVVTLGTSGHADARALQAMVEVVHPSKIIPMHTNNINWFINEFKNISIVKDDSLTL